MIYADEVVVSHTNENEYASFVGNRKSEALQDRIILVKVPYNLRVTDEVKIYEKLLRQSALKDVHIAPHTLRVASIFAVLTRLEESQEGGHEPDEEAQALRRRGPRRLQAEGRQGAAGGGDARGHGWHLAALCHQPALQRAGARRASPASTPIDALRALRDGLDQHTSITRDQREQLSQLHQRGAQRVRRDGASKEVQRAFVYSFEESARTLLNNYLDNVEAYCNKTKVRDPITDEDMEPDEQLMRSIEEQIGITENAKKTFREEILIRISSLARRGQTFDYTSHERLKEAIEKKLFADLRDVVKITTSAKTPDPEQLKKSNEVVSRLISDHGYCTICANELLNYVGSLLNR